MSQIMCGHCGAREGEKFTPGCPGCEAGQRAARDALAAIGPALEVLGRVDKRLTWELDVPWHRRLWDRVTGRAPAKT